MALWREMCKVSGVISAQFAFPAAAYTPPRMPTDPAAEARKTETRDNDSSQSQRRSTAFSHVLSQVSQSEQDGNDSANGSAPQQTRNDNDGADATPKTGTANPAPPLAPTVTMAALLGSVQALPALAQNAAGGKSSGNGQPAKTEIANLPTALAAAKTAQKSAAAKTETSESGAENLSIPLELAEAGIDALQAGADSTAAAKAASLTLGPARESANAPATTTNASVTAGNLLAFSMLVTADAGNDNNASGGSAAAGADAPMTGDLKSVAAVSASAALETTNPAPVPHDLQTQANAWTAGETGADARHNTEDRPPPAEQTGAGQQAYSDSMADSSRSELVRNVHVQLQSDNNQRVDVQFTGSGTELRVSVRSADANLTEALRDHMPELTNRLDQQHFRTEVWIPRSAEASKPSSSDARDSGSNGGSTANQDNSGRRQNGRQNDQPDWMDQDIPAKTSNKETGNQLWLQ